MGLLTRKGYLIEEQGMTYLAEAGPDAALTREQIAHWTVAIADKG